MKQVRYISVGACTPQRFLLPDKSLFTFRRQWGLGQGWDSKMNHTPSECPHVPVPTLEIFMSLESESFSPWNQKT